MTRGAYALGPEGQDRGQTAAIGQAAAGQHPGPGGDADRQDLARFRGYAESDCEPVAVHAAARTRRSTSTGIRARVIALAEWSFQSTGYRFFPSLGFA
jgi:hypothetical protein